MDICQTSSLSPIAIGHYTHPKLAPQFIGPFLVAARIGPVASIGHVAYGLALPQPFIQYFAFLDSNRPIFPIPKIVADDRHIPSSSLAVLGLHTSSTNGTSLEVLS